MSRLILYPGDIILTTSLGIVGKAITTVEQIWSLDRQSEYSHVTTALGGDSIFEAVAPRIAINHIQKYNGTKVCVLRYDLMTKDRFEAGWKAVQKHEGQIYPFQRLLLHLFRVSNLFHWKRLVCSELAIKQLYYSTILHCDEISPCLSHWYGWNPDNVHDLRNWKNITQVFEGKLNV